MCKRQLIIFAILLFAFMLFPARAVSGQDVIEGNTGDIIVFDNEDEFLHHVMVESLNLFSEPKSFDVSISDLIYNEKFSVSVELPYTNISFNTPSNFLYQTYGASISFNYRF